MVLRRNKGWSIVMSGITQFSCKIEGTGTANCQFLCYCNPRWRSMLLNSEMFFGWTSVWKLFGFRFSQIYAVKWAWWQEGCSGIWNELCYNFYFASVICSILLPQAEAILNWKSIQQFHGSLPRSIGNGMFIYSKSYPIYLLHFEI